MICRCLTRACSRRATSRARLSCRVRAPSEAWRFLAGCKSLRSTVSPATPPECGSGEGGQSRTTQLKRTQGIPQTVGQTAFPEA